MQKNIRAGESLGLQEKSMGGCLPLRQGQKVNVHFAGISVLGKVEELWLRAEGDVLGKEMVSLESG
jgi:hypothetical protein